MGTLTSKGAQSRRLLWVLAAPRRILFCLLELWAIAAHGMNESAFVFDQFSMGEHNEHSFL
jgi:hypothetical protein